MRTGSAARWLKLAPWLALGVVFFSLEGPANSAAGGQVRKEGAGRLESVQVNGSSRYQSNQIVDVTGLKRGQTLTKEDMQRAADRLAQLGPFADVQYRFSSAGESVKVDYQVKDAPSLLVVFDNFPSFTDDELVSALKNSVVLFDGTAPDHGTILDEMTLALERLLMTRNLSGTVVHEVVTSPLHEGFVVQFRVEGVELTLEGIDFSDSLAKSDRGIQERLADIVGKPYSRSRIELFENEQIYPVYVAHGYLRVQFGVPVTHFASSPGNQPPNGVVALVPINPGPLFTWDGATWTGNSAIASGELGKLADVKRGDPANGMQIEAIWDGVRAAYGRIGYLDVGLRPVPRFNDSAKSVHFDVSISEGPQYRMGNLVLTGLSIEGEHRIRAAWSIPAGAVFDQSKYDSFLEEGINRAFIGLPVHYEKIGRFLQKDPATAKIDVLIDFQ